MGETPAQGEGAACASADAVTEPVGTRTAPMTETAMPGVRCSALLGDDVELPSCGWVEIPVQVRDGEQGKEMLDPSTGKWSLLSRLGQVAHRRVDAMEVKL